MVIHEVRFVVICPDWFMFFGRSICMNLMPVHRTESADLVGMSVKFEWQGVAGVGIQSVILQCYNLAVCTRGVYVAGGIQRPVCLELTPTLATYLSN